MKHKFAVALSAKCGAMVAAVLSFVSFGAQAVDLGVKVEPSTAAALSASQSQRFSWGGGVSAKGMIGLVPFADATAGVGFIGLPAPAGSASSESGAAWSFGGGLRLKRPHDGKQFSGASPWLDGDALYVRTGPLNRFGFAAGAGISFPVGDARQFWIGPFVRYLQVVQAPSRALYDNRDLKTLLLGLSFEFGTSPMSDSSLYRDVKVVPEPIAVREPEPAVVDPGVSDQNEPKVIDRPDKLELTEKIQFAYDKSLIESVSYPALDGVVRALQNNRGFRVEIEGHASSEGMEAHNQGLSEGRAQAVLDYLVSHGVSSERLASKGFSSSQPLQSNSTTSGREANRRVEFVVRFIVDKRSVQ